jgi:hypothetical protein
MCEKGIIILPTSQFHYENNLNTFEDLRIVNEKIISPLVLLSLLKLSKQHLSQLSTPQSLSYIEMQKATIKHGEGEIFL